MDQQGARAMSDQNRGDLSDKEKIDRAAKHEEVRFLKRQQWAVAAAGVILLGGFLATIRSEQMHDVTLLEKILAVTLIAAGVWAGWLANLPTRDETRRIAANIAKLPDILKQS
jgi:hypothetical protein